MQFVVKEGATRFNFSDTLTLANDSNDVQITTLKFYVSKIQFLKRHKIVFEEKNSFHLVDFSNAASLQIAIASDSKLSYDELRFNIGIDSATNVSGAMGNDLDPTKGMYWTWQSGYINFKLEGQSVLCNTRNNEFQFHLGGYMSPYVGLQTLIFPVKNKTKVSLQLDISKIITSIDLAKSNHIMSPSTEGVLLSKIIANSFTVYHK